jgi:hypothetical protein
VAKLATPDVTKAQMTAVATAIVGALAAAGLPLSEANANRIYTAAVAVAVAQVIADAVIRFGRALMAGKKLDDSDIGLD